MKVSDKLRKKYNEILEKLKDENFKLDISKDEDLSFAIMNLISIEEHSFMSGVKTGNKKYFEILNEVRELRKELMKEIVKEAEEGAEVWCITKHLLAATMRLSEVGTKLLRNNKEKAYEYFGKAYKTYTLFWALNLGIYSLDEIKEEIEKDEKMKEEIEKSKEMKEEIKSEEKTSDKLKSFIKKIVNCCLE
ncbi:MAG: hypothetical protein QW367_03205 [Candidatus Aenigmatarchaeota archaeon]